jgi:hypothetical protein
VSLDNLRSIFLIQHMDVDSSTPVCTRSFPVDFSVGSFDRAGSSASKLFTEWISPKTKSGAAARVARKTALFDRCKAALKKNHSAVRSAGGGSGQRAALEKIISDEMRMGVETGSGEAMSGGSTDSQEWYGDLTEDERVELLIELERGMLAATDDEAFARWEELKNEEENELNAMIDRFDEDK